MSRWHDPRLRPALRDLRSGIVFIALSILILLVWQGRSGWAEAQQNAVFLLLILAISLIRFGWRLRVADGFYCARCGASRAGEADLLRDCPGCGARWNETGGTRSGKYIRQWWLIALGALLAGLAIATTMLG